MKRKVLLKLLIRVHLIKKEDQSQDTTVVVNIKAKVKLKAKEKAKVKEKVKAKERQMLKDLRIKVVRA